MNKLTFLCLIAIFLMAATCGKIPKDQTSEKACIDKSKINPDGICTMQYDPVCGCDGKTYSNDCVATHAGVTQWTKGACDDKTKVEKDSATESDSEKEKKPELCIDKSKIRKRPCADVYQPVCGCNGKTYPNKCDAKNKGLTSWTPGKCS